MGVFPPGVKLQGREADHSPPASAEVKKMWIYTSIPPYAFMAQYLINYAQGQLNIFLFQLAISMCWSRDSSVGIATVYGLDDQGGGSSSPGRVKKFRFSISCRSAPGSTQPPIKWVLGALSPGVKRQGSEADHSPPTSAEVKKMWIYTSTPLCVFMA
jgi:hypothetical protein